MQLLVLPKKKQQTTHVSHTNTTYCLTWWSGHSHVLEVTSLDDLHLESPSRSVVGQSQQKFRHSTMLHGLGGGSTVTARQTGHVKT